jgi:hypothetical protein
MVSQKFAEYFAAPRLGVPPLAKGGFGGISSLSVEQIPLIPPLFQRGKRRLSPAEFLNELQRQDTRLHS